MSQEAPTEIAESSERKGAPPAVKDGYSKGPKWGENYSVSTTTTVDEKGKVSNDGVQTEITDSLGGNSTAASKSDDQEGVSLEAGDLIVLGFEAGATNQGFKALGDALLQSYGALVTDPPTPPKTPAPPPTAIVIPEEDPNRVEYKNGANTGCVGDAIKTHGCYEQ